MQYEKDMVVVILVMIGMVIVMTYVIFAQSKDHNRLLIWIYFTIEYKY